MRRRGVLAVGILALLVVGLPAVSDLLLLAFPVTVQLCATPRGLTIAADGQQFAVTPSSRIISVNFPTPQPYSREYQIDGSDSTNVQNLDAGYFSRIATSPYYRFQSWLRDEGSFSRWRNLRIAGDSGAVAATVAAPEGGSRYPLSETFSLDVDLHRPEIPRSFSLEEEDGGTVTIELNRNDRYLSVVERLPGGETRPLDRRFFPNDWRPFAAELGYMALRELAVASAILLLLSLLTAAIATRIAPRLDGVPRRVIVVAAVGGALAGGLYSSVYLFDRAPHILDAVSYLFQAKVIAGGGVTVPAPPVSSAFPTPFTVIHGGRWFSQYPPGAPAVLAAGLLLGVPWAVEPLLAMASVGLLYRIGSEQYGRGTGALAAVLMASSPFLMLQSGSFLSHVPAMFFGCCLLYGVTRYLAKPETRWLVIASLGLSMMFLTREAAAILCGAPVVAFLIWRMRASGQRVTSRALFLPISCLAVTALGYLAYNWALAGSPFQLPRLLFNGTDRFGFGDGIGFYGRHTLAAGMMNADELLTSLSIVLFGWPFYFTLALLAFSFLPGKSDRWDGLNGSVFAIFVVAHIAYFYHGIALGPRYYFEALPFLALLTARGFSAVAETAASLAGALTGRDRSRQGRVATATLAVLLFCCNLFYFLPRQSELYRGFTGLPGGEGPRMGDFVRYELSGRTSALSNALVVTDDWWIYSVYLAPLNSPRLDGPAVFALSSNKGDEARLRAAFPERFLYRLQLRDGALEAEPQRY